MRKKVYVEPTICLLLLEVEDVVRTSNENNDLEWDWN